MQLRTLVTSGLVWESGIIHTAVLWIAVIINMGC